MNERHFGNLTGMKRFDAVTKYGKDEVLKWQYSFDATPPLMDENHKHFTDITEDIRYINGPSAEEMPKGESLKMTLERVQPYWNSIIIPQLKKQKTLLLICHGDVLRSLVKFLNGISDEEIEDVSFLAGVPMVFDLDSEFNPAAPMYFLAEGSLDKAMVSIQAKGRIIMK
ncbi:hypothetical protein R5R35_006335 [Gryllus longicercus]|uniref:phosphoglycerate mutase (2,3-diphosphoglycerate-dependent) n=1 Tax=Gryllus longicercus TaxID=2509291 RepID=A0AAN9ZH02_9ORTH